MDKDAIDRHIAAVRELSRPGGALSVEAPTVSTANPDWWNGSFPTIDRLDLHEQILNETKTKFASAGHDKRALVMAGPPGAGKSYRARQILGDEAENYAWVDPDEFKASLLDAASADQSIDSWFKKGAIADYERENNEHFFPMELASLVHTESSRLATQARNHFIAEGRNVVVDTVLGTPEKAQELGDRLAEAGFTVHLVDVEISAEDSASSIAARHRHRFVAALEGSDTLGGRWVPSEYARSVFGADGEAKSLGNAEQFAHTFDNVTHFERYRTQWDGDHLTGLPREVNKIRASPGEPLVDKTWSGSTTPLSPRTVDGAMSWPSKPTLDPKPGHNPEL